MNIVALVDLIDAFADFADAGVGAVEPKSAAASEKGNSERMVLRCTGRSQIRAVIPRMSSILAMLLPNTLPVAKPELPSMLAITPMMSSGREVPMETMVNPMIISEMPNREATAVAPFTNHSAPLMSNTKPSANKRYVIIKCANVPMG